MTQRYAAEDWISSQLMTDKCYEAHYYSDKDFGTVSFHSHDFFELYFFIRGKATYIVEDKHYRLQSGDILLISPSDLHQLSIADSSSTYERIVLWIRPAYIRRLSTARTDLSECFRTCSARRNWLVRDENLSELLLPLLRDICVASHSEEYGDDVSADAGVQRVLLEINRFMRKSPSAARQSAPDTVSRAVEYIESNLGGELSLDTLAARLFVSKYHLTRLFNEHTGIPPHRYILKKRLVLSKRLIEEGLNLNDVCARCGFSDYTHFFRAFKNEFGITPKQHYAMHVASLRAPSED